MLELVESILGVQSDVMGWIVGVTFICLALAFFCGAIFPGNRGRKWRTQTPAALTGIGMLGTFAGITYALWNLEIATDMTASISDFLEGMKGAFWTSLGGLSASIFFRALVALGWVVGGGGQRVPDPDLEKVLVALNAIHTAIAGKSDGSLSSGIERVGVQLHDGFNKQQESLDAVRQALGGDDEGSVSRRLDAMRVELSERLEALRGAQIEGFGKLDTLTETIREAIGDNLKALIAELHDSIGKEFRESINRLVTDIERALIDQFGKTFVQFNDATQAIKRWQEEHRGHVEKMTQAFNAATDGMASIAENCAQIPVTMDSLGQGVKVIQHDVGLLNGQLEAFASLRAQAEQSFPTIKKHLDGIGEDLASSAKGLSGMQGTIERALQEAEASVKRTVEAHSADVKDMAGKMRSTIEEAQRQSADKALSAVKSTMDKFANEVSQEMDRIVREWGGNMVGIAERCNQVLDERRR